MISHQSERKIHLAVSLIATLCIAAFFTSTVIVELFGTVDQIVMIKNLILMPGLLILIPAMAATGGTGFALAKTRKCPLLESKKKRMPFIAANGILILIPCAVFLERWASAGAFGVQFYLVQSIELLAGITNLTLMGLNIRDGLRLTGKSRTDK